MTDADYRLLVDSVRDYAIFMLDPDGRIRSWNAGARQLKGYAPEEAIGRSFEMFYPQEQIDRGSPRAGLREAVRVGRYEDEGWRLRKDGSRFWASVVITALHDDHGVHYGFAKVTRDMSDRRRIDTLESQERHLHQVLALLGHELRNPLAPIVNAVSMMRLEEPRSPRLRDVRDILDRQVTYLVRLVDDLLDVGRIVSGRVHIERVPVTLQEVVADSVEAVSAAMRARAHRFDVTVPPEDVWVLGDKMRLVQMLTNLLNNAAKFTPPGGEVRLSLSHNGASAQLAVADNGPGIPPDDLPYVFKLFAQSQHEHARIHGGLGIGLSVVHQMAHRHDGEVSAFSTGEPGKGVEFVVELPAIAPPA